nr:calcium-independent phospholipase a2-gamma [Quercus suber]
MDESGRLRRKDTTKGPPLRILSLDGGGVRGYSMLIIVQELMHKMFVEIEGRPPRRDEIPRPCDYFDLIAGTGTGGLIAIMLGRLRMDVETCKTVYVRMTRRVFETDKTFAGIPYKSTMFKASKLEDAIRECVAQHTISEYEGNDVLANATPMSPDMSGPPSSPTSVSGPSRSLSQSSRYSQIGGMSPITQRAGFGSLRWGDANALLYDTRENRTKTAVTAVLRGTPHNVFLRSYDSRKETAPDVNCTIWQAGRATAATALAFKPIQIGQSVYLDEGAGKFNPSSLVLDEAVRTEWPGREVGVFMSIGTGKRPAGNNHRQSEWWEGVLGGGIMGDYAEARRRLISKLEACEDIHQYMLREHLTARGVDRENYYRFNVEIGVGEFGMNEWARLAEISSNTRIYLAKDDVTAMAQSAAAKMAKIYFTKVRQERAEARRQEGQSARNSWQNPWDRPLPTSAPPPPSLNPMAVELPGDEGFRPGSQHYEHRPSIADQKYTVIADPPMQSDHDGSRNSYDYPASPDHGFFSRPSTKSSGTHSPPSSQPLQPAHSLHYVHQQQQSASDHAARPSGDFQQQSSPPPLPPKTPLPFRDSQSSPTPEGTSPTYYPQPPKTFTNMGDLGQRLPYPDIEGPPPPVNSASKPSI